jgi:hypothetical protein
MAYNNCLFWAVGKLLTQGGYIGMRRSKYGPVPHFIWSKNLKKWYGFVPKHPRTGWVACMVKLCFRGRVAPEPPP